MSLSPASRAKLETCDPRLVAVVLAVAEHSRFVVVCGHRGQADQDRAVARGASRTPWPTSRHNSTPSEAVDLAPLDATGAVDWEDRQAFAVLAGAVLHAAAVRGVRLEWGGHWPSFPDLPHFQLAR